MYTNIKQNSLADAHYDNETAAAGEWTSNNGFVLHAWLNLLWKQNSAVLFMALQNSWHWRPSVLKLYRYMHLPAGGSNFVPPTGFWFLKMSTDAVLVSRCLNEWANPRWRPSLCCAPWAPPPLIQHWGGRSIWVVKGKVIHTNGLPWHGNLWNRSFQWINSHQRVQKFTEILRRRGLWGLMSWYVLSSDAWISPLTACPCPARLVIGQPLLKQRGTC